MLVIYFCYIFFCVNFLCMSGFLSELVIGNSSTTMACSLISQYVIDVPVEVISVSFCTAHETFLQLL